MNQAEKLTTINLKIVKKFTKDISLFCEGILLSGSNAWGAYYAVTPKSDIDLLVVVSDIKNLRAIIKLYAKENLVDSIENKRFQKFTELYKDGKANHFSVVTHFLSTPVSIDFFLQETVQRITSLAPMNTLKQKEITIRTTKEFRKNKPRVAGYSLDDLRGKRKLTYHPKFKEVKSNQGEVLGYLSKTLVDGITPVGSSPAYFLGVMSFFLCIEPVVLVDKNKFLRNSINALQKNIAIIMNQQKPAYITRQERMSKIHLNRIKSALYGSRD